MAFITMLNNQRQISQYPLLIQRDLLQNAPSDSIVVPPCEEKKDVATVDSPSYHPPFLGPEPLAMKIPLN